MIKRFALGLLALILSTVAAPAFAQPGITQKVAPCDWSYPNRCMGINPDGSVRVSPATGVTITDRGGTITLGGAAQAAIALNASRRGWCIMNDPAAAETLYVRSNGTASATTGVALSPGQQACNQPGIIDTAAISVFAATTSHRWYGSEAQ